MQPVRERVVVVGNGMASLRLLERLTEGVSGRFEMTVIGAEPVAAYNRVLLSSLLGGEVEEAGCAFRDRDWYAGHGIALHTGAPVTAIGRADRTVTAGGRTVPYDHLVLATGSLPIRLRKPGMDLPGVVTFRDLADVAAIRRAATAGARGVVVGGGLLGLEAAVGLARLGVATTLVHVMDRLMERQLDGPAAALVRAAIEARGVEVVLNADTAAVEGEGRVEVLRLADGRMIPADLVVMSVGVRPNVGLAQDAGLDIGRGVRVDDAMRTSDPAIFALGECAEHRGLTYGLVEPAYEQADVLARRLIAGAGSYAGTALATSLKVSGLPVFSAGEVIEAEGDEAAVWSDPGLGLYRKLVVRDGRLVGAVFVGDVAEQAAVRAHLRSAVPLAPGAADDLMFGPVALAA
jgi:nitrite reductase (NADH) large subunit